MTIALAMIRLCAALIPHARIVAISSRRTGGIVFVEECYITSNKNQLHGDDHGAPVFSDSLLVCHEIKLQQAPPSVLEQAVPR